MDRRIIGALFLAAGVLCLIAPLTQMPESLSQEWWMSPARMPDIVRALAAIVGVAIVLLGGLLWRRHQSTKQADAGAAGAWDVTVQDPARVEQEWAGTGPWPARFLPWIGAACVVLGLGVVIGQWMLLHTTVPAAQLVLPLNKTVEHYEANIGGRSMKVMLPLRVTLTGMQLGERPEAHVRFARIGDDGAPSQVLVANETLDIDDVRVAMIGLSPASTTLRATLTSDKPDTISGTGVAGDVFKVALEGTEFEILEVSANYLGSLGPAVKLSSEQDGEFWVFQRAVSAKPTLVFEHGLKLESVESIPSVVLSVVNKPQPFAPVFGGFLFMLGFALLLLFPERVAMREVGPEGGSRDLVASLNDGGALSLEVAQGAEVSS